MSTHFNDFSSKKETLKQSALPVKFQRKKVVVISGPTAVGKTTVSLHLAKLLGGEIISADSMQVYRGMDIGTAKVTRDQQLQIPHHLIDIKNLDESFNVSDFFIEVKKVTQSILARKNVPIIVGGTGFYIDALIHGPPTGPPSDPKVRKFLERKVEVYGPEPLYERIRKMDPLYAESITARDKHKIIRALEIMIITKKKVSDFSPLKHSKGLDLDFSCWFLTMDRKRLYQRIEARCDEMLEDGLLKEVEALSSIGLEKNSTASQAIGYKQILDYLNGKRSEDNYQECIQKFKQLSRHYAKKQYTWFRKKPEFRWIDLDKYNAYQAIQLIFRNFQLL